LVTKGNINTEITTSKNGIADIERVHNTINEKRRLIITHRDAEDNLMNIEKATNVYNHEKNHDVTNISNGIKPSKNMQKQKVHKIDKIIKDREEHEVGLEWTKVEKEMKHKAK